MLISTAYAQAAGGAAAEGSGLISLLPLVLIFVVFWFLLIRPQQKKMKQHRAMVDALKRGDKVVTGGGLIGTVAKVVDDGEVQVELAEGVKVRVLRHTIQDILTKPQPTSASKAGDSKAKSQPANDSGDEKKKSGLSSLFGSKKPD